jgi:dihydrofolate reductase
MRKVISGLFISLDGVTESPNLWQFDNFDADMMAALGSFMAAQDAVLMGRVTYQEWAGYWPTSKDEPFASFINNIPKYVVSTTLHRVDWNNTTLLKGPLAEEITALKQQPGKSIGVTGSPTLVRSLLQNDLLDELTLMVHPVVAGEGKRLFDGVSSLKRMKLVGSQITTTGVAVLTYHPRQD